VGAICILMSVYLFIDQHKKIVLQLWLQAAMKHHAAIYRVEQKVDNF